MRISDCAELTGTTVRTIRYYHQVGLLAVPERVGGRRDYELEHVARIQRIRWLAEAGLSLEAIAGVLHEEDHGQPASTTVRDLRATAQQIDQRMAELQQQRERIGDLLVMAEEGRSLRALPAGLEQFYDELLTLVDDADTRRGILQERRLAEIMAQRGMASSALTDVLTEMDEAARAVIIDFYTGYGTLPRLQGAEAEAEIQRLVGLMTTWCQDHPDLVARTFATFPAWSLTPRMLSALMSLTAMTTPDHNQRRTMLRLKPVLLELAAANPAKEPS